MNKRIKLTQSEESKVYITTDTHLNHDPKWAVPLWEGRGFKSSSEHTCFIIDTINKMVRPGDKLIHLGDFCLNTTEAQCEELLSRIMCQNIYMLWGNHNNPLWKVYQREVASWVAWNEDGNQPGNCDFGDPITEVYPFRYRNVVFMGNYLEAIIDRKLYIMEHYPIHVFNEMSHGAYHLCGHSHYGLDFSRAENLGNKILDVAWDGWKRPYTPQEIEALMNKKAIFATTDHHKSERPEGPDV
jgi:calcineurin-like phosphoesterase family protein